MSMLPELPQSWEDLDKIIELEREAERNRWATWIGNTLTKKYPQYNIILWEIAECMEKNIRGKRAASQN